MRAPRIQSNSRTKRNAGHPSVGAAANIDRYTELVRLMASEEFRGDLQQALDNPFEVVVLATMSAGKSTLLNALLGMDLLPSKNEACTAVVYRVVDRDGMAGLRCRAVVGKEVEDWQPATGEILAGWNHSDRCSLVEVEGDLPFVKNAGARLVLYDTPGPNNSREKLHQEVMRGVLQSRAFGLILYVLNATQFGVNDERALLSEMAGVLRDRGLADRKHVVFVLNKADELGGTCAVGHRAHLRGTK